jgi:Pterin 4 alpha carbinolamine dehydratase
MPRLSDDDVRAALTGGLAGWEFDDLENHDHRVLVALSTHDEGGVTERDIALARAIESVVESSES